MSSNTLSGKEPITWVFVCLMVMALVPRVSAQGFFENRSSFLITAGNTDVYRGLLRNERDATVYASAKAQFGGLSVGAGIHDAQFSGFQGSVVDETELTYYVSWSQHVNTNFAWQLKLQQYRFPGSSNVFFEYDYNELSLNLEFPAGLNLLMGSSDSNLSFAQGIAYSELAWRRAIPAGIEFSAGLGGVRTLSGERRGYAYWDIGVSRLFKSVAVDVRYHYSPFDENWLGRKPANGLWAVSLTKKWSH